MPTLDQSAAPESMVDIYQLGFGTIWCALTAFFKAHASH